MHKRKTAEEIPDEMLPVKHGRDELLTLYSLNDDDLRRAQDVFESENPENTLENLIRSPQSRWCYAQNLKSLYRSHKDGDLGATLEALNVCFANGLPIPRWCELAFKKAHAKIQRFDFKSWDDVFGKPHPINTQVAAERDKMQLGILIFCRVLQIKHSNRGRGINKDLFEQIGEEFNLSGSTAERFYRGVKTLIS